MQVLSRPMPIFQVQERGQDSTRSAVQLVAQDDAQYSVHVMVPTWSCMSRINGTVWIGIMQHVMGAAAPVGVCMHSASNACRAS